MKTAVDTSALLAIFKGEAEGAPGSMRSNAGAARAHWWYATWCAQKQADRLAAKDRGYLSRYFQTLSVVTP